MWLAVALKPLALAGAAAGLLWVRRAVKRLPDSRLKRFLLWPGEARKPESRSGDASGGSAGPQ